MWLFFGIGAILCAVMNGLRAHQNRNADWFRFASMALTALTVCAFYSDAAVRVVHEDWNGLVDILPTMGKFLWICVGVSILINSVSLFKKSRRSDPGLPTTDRDRNE